MTQSLASMTGYSRAAGRAEGCAFAVEIKSVNARGLDLRARLAPGLDAIEGELRRRVGQSLARGAVTVTVALEREGAGGEVVVNQQALTTVLAALERLGEQVDADRPRLDGILALKGVLEQREIALGADAEEGLHRAILDAIDGALQDLVSARRAEGARLRDVLLAHVDEIAALTDRARLHPSRQREVVLDRLRLQLAELNAAGVGLSEDRLAQEALLLATKADIQEEIDRLVAHVAAARKLIAQGGPVGRKLDFLAQEFNREANTLCSKSNAVELTGIGLDLKASIDQLREQVQNIE